MCGLVISVSPGTEGFSVGDFVFGRADSGSLSEYASSTVSHLVKVVPSPVSDLFKYYGSIAGVGCTTFMAFQRSGHGPDSGAGKTCVVRE